jgi:Holliday junction resolvase RusA-like endonuclease
VDKNHPIHVYRDATALAARAAKIPLSVDGDVVMEIEFVFGRPPSHLTKRGALSSTALPRPKGDLDNYAKGIGDALNGVAYADDSQVVGLNVRKRYGPAGMPPVTLVTLHYLGGDFADSHDGADVRDLCVVDGPGCPKPSGNRRAVRCAGRCDIRPKTPK